MMTVSGIPPSILTSEVVPTSISILALLASGFSVYTAYRVSIRQKIGETNKAEIRSNELCHAAWKLLGAGGKFPSPYETDFKGARDIEGARVKIETALKVSPDNAYAYCLRAISEIVVGRKTDLIESDFKQALALDEVNKQATVHYGLYLGEFYRYYFGGKRYLGGIRIDDAINLLEDAIERDQDFSAAMHSLALVYINKKYDDDALKLLIKALKIEPKNLMYLYDLGWLYYKIDRHKNGLEQLQAAVDNGANSVRVYYFKALCEERMDKLECARDSILKAHQHKPKDPEVKTALDRIEKKISK